MVLVVVGSPVAEVNGWCLPNRDTVVSKRVAAKIATSIVGGRVVKLLLARNDVNPVKADIHGQTQIGRAHV